MNRIALSALALLSSAVFSCAGELSAITKDFVTAVGAGNSEDLAKLYVDSPAKDKVLASFKEALPLIKKGHLKVSAVDKELTIGDLGVALVRLESPQQSVTEYDPLICVRTDSQWLAFPLGSEADLKALYDQRSPEEQIHLQLFTKWADLTEKQLLKEAAKDNSVRIGLDAQGTLTLAGERIQTDELKQKLVKIASDPSSLTIVISADNDCTSGQVTELMESLGETGIKNVTLVTSDD